MTALLLLPLSVVAGVVPMVVFALIVWALDRYEREPLPLVGALFVWGGSFAVVLAIVFSSLFGLPVELALPGSDALTMAVAGLRDGPAPARAVVISSTSYYGVPHGPVDEDTPPGRSDRALRCVGMEKVFRDWAGAGGVVLRCGGLYQKGRGPMSALERRGEAPLGPPDKTLALIHYADAGTAAFEALRHPAPRDTYLAVTPPCPTRQAFYQAACVVAGLDLPGFGPKLRKPLAEFDVARLRADLLPAPAHPRWQEALLPGDA